MRRCLSYPVEPGNRGRPFTSNGGFLRLASIPGSVASPHKRQRHPWAIPSPNTSPIHIGTIRPLQRKQCISPSLNDSSLCRKKSFAVETLDKGMLCWISVHQSLQGFGPSNTSMGTSRIQSRLNSLTGTPSDGPMVDACRIADALDSPELKHEPCPDPRRSTCQQAGPRGVRHRRR